MSTVTQAHHRPPPKKRRLSYFKPADLISTSDTVGCGWRGLPGHPVSIEKPWAAAEGAVTQPGSVFPAAFEDMLENPLNSTQWMNDPETGPVMLQISRIFQTLNRT